MSAVAAVIVILPMLGYLLWSVVATIRDLRRDREYRIITLAGIVVLALMVPACILVEDLLPSSHPPVTR